MALKLYSISLKDIAVEISVAKGPADRLARDGADHEERHEPRTGASFRTQ